jgi:hypothetical protein
MPGRNAKLRTLKKEATEGTEELRAKHVRSDSQHLDGSTVSGTLLRSLRFLSSTF